MNNVILIFVFKITLLLKNNTSGYDLFILYYLFFKNKIVLLIIFELWFLRKLKEKGEERRGEERGEEREEETERGEVRGRDFEVLFLVVFGFLRVNNFVSGRGGGVSKKKKIKKDMN